MRPELWILRREGRLDEAGRRCAGLCCAPIQPTLIGGERMGKFGDDDGCGPIEKHRRAVARAGGTGEVGLDLTGVRHLRREAQEERARSHRRHADSDGQDGGHAGESQPES